MKGKNTVVGANKVFFWFTMLFMIFQLILTILVAVLSILNSGIDTMDLINKNIYIILLINQFIIVLIPVLVYTIKNKLNIKEVFKLNKLKFKPAVIITLLIVPSFFVAAMLNTFAIYILQFIGDVPTQSIPVPKTLSELIVGILIVGVTPAICEEMMHRGIMLSAYEKRGSMKAIVISAIFFGIFHFDITNLLGATFLGLLIGYYVVKTNSIFAGVLAHFLNNSLNEVLQYFIGDSVPKENVVSISFQELFGSILYGIVGLIVIGLLLKIFNKAVKGTRELIPSISSVRNDVKSIATHWPIVVIIILYILMAAMYIYSLVLTRLNVV